MAEDVQIISKAPLQIATTLGADVAMQRKGPGAAADSDADRELIELLETTHPDYDENIGLWRMTADIALNRIVSNADKKKYLFQGTFEDDKHFAQRVEMTKFLPETPSLLSDFTGAVFSKPAQREFKELDGNVDPAIRSRTERMQEKISDFRNSAGPESQPISRMAMEAAKLALVYGSVDAVLDHPAEEETVIPIMSLMTPDKRFDWQVGEDGNFLWVKYAEDRTVKAEWNKARIPMREYRIITAPGEEGPGQIFVFRVFEFKGRKVVVPIEPIEHLFPSIPVRTLYWNKLAPGIGDPWVKILSEADVKILRQESDLSWDVFVHAHPLLLAWLNKLHAKDTPLTDMKIGTNWALHLNPGQDEMPKEDIDYRSPLSPALDLQQSLAKDTRMQAQRLAGNSPETMERITAESGVAIAYRQAQRAKNFTQLARGLEEWEWQETELVVSEGQPEMVELKGSLQISYPDKFDQRLSEELHQDLLSARETGSPTAVKEISKKLAIKLVGDGVTQELIDAINEEIEAKVAPEDEDAVEGIDTPIEGEPARENLGGAIADVNELTLGIERIARVGDFDMANILRRALAEKLGVPAPKDLREADVVSFRKEVAPAKKKPGDEI